MTPAEILVFVVPPALYFGLLTYLAWPDAVMALLLAALACVRM